MLYFIMLKTVGEKIYSIRLAKGLTQADIVRQTGIPQPNLSNIEKGKQDITLTTLFRLAKAFNVSPGEFLTPLSAMSEKRSSLTRSKVERIAKAAVHPQFKLSQTEQNIANDLRIIVPMPGKKAPGNKEVYRAWLALKKLYGHADLKTCIERVRDELQRSRWTLN
jgi:transcriptional regulator with XRE-family HTH domain